MKKLLLVSLVAASLGLAASSFGQAAGPVGAPPAQNPTLGKGGKGQRGGGEKMNAELLAKLNLTDDQKTKLKAHEDEMKTKTDALKGERKAAKGDVTKQEALKEKVKALRKENQEFMKTLFTKDQLKELAKLRREATKDKAGTTATPPRPSPEGLMSSTVPGIRKATGDGFSSEHSRRGRVLALTVASAISRETP